MRLATCLAAVWLSVTGSTLALAAYSPPHKHMAPKKLPLAGITVFLDPPHGSQYANGFIDSGTKWYAQPSGQRQAVLYTEAGTGYRVTALLGRRLSALGASVHYTVESSKLSVGTVAEPPSLPHDVRYAGTKQLAQIRPCGRSKEEAIGRRVRPIRVWLQDGHAKPSHALYLAVHVDALPLGSGSCGGMHVCINPAQGEPTPLIARIMARRLAPGKARSWSIRKQELVMINHDANPLPERAVVEIGYPRTSKEDCQRLTSEAGRQCTARLLADCILEWKRRQPNS